MAIISPSALVTEMRGKVGNMVFSKNASGPFVRAYVSPNQPVSSGQLNYLTVNQTVAGYWLNLSDSQKSQWNKFSRSHPYYDALGNRRTYSGYQFFMKTNWWLENLSLPILYSPVGYRRMPIFRGTTEFEAPDILRITNDLQYSNSSYVIVRYASNQVFPAKKQFFRPDYRFIQTSGGGFTGTTNIYFNWNTVFGGPLISGRRVGMWMRFLDPTTGAMSKGFYISDIVQ